MSLQNCVLAGKPNVGAERRAQGLWQTTYWERESWQNVDNDDDADVVGLRYPRGPDQGLRIIIINITMILYSYFHCHYLHEQHQR